jgi:hypothetical protein
MFAHYSQTAPRDSRGMATKVLSGILELCLLSFMHNTG